MSEANEVQHEEHLLFTQAQSPHLSDTDEGNESREDEKESVPRRTCILQPSPVTANLAEDHDLSGQNHQSTKSDAAIEDDIASIGMWNVNGDDDGSSQSSISSSQGPVVGAPMTLTERRAFNIKRNNALLTRLGMMNNKYLSPSKTTARWKDEVGDSINSPEPSSEHRRGMIIPTCWANLERQRRESSPKSLFSSLKDLYDRYPHRSVQIRKLFSLLSVSVSMLPEGSSLPPPPIFVIGPAGSGKTMIVRDVVQLCCCMNHESLHFSELSTVSEAPEALSHSTKRQRIVLNAYIDCGTLDSFSMEEFFSSAFSQWRAQIPGKAAAEPTRKRHPKKRQTPRQPVDQPHTRSSKDQTAPHRTRFDRKRRAKSASQKTSSDLNKDLLNLKSGTGTSLEGPMLGLQNITLTAVWTFGRALQHMLNKMKRDGLLHVSVLLIVDHAELLLSLGTSQARTLAGDRINMLAQLLMLPQAFGFNLNIIAISKNALLEHTALNSIKSQGTIGIHICPTSIYFPAYRGKAVIQTILVQDNMKRLVVGEDSNNSSAFFGMVFRSFLETLIQSLSEMTSDIKEYVRLGRSLWPKYILPITPDNIAETLIHVQEANKQRSSNENVTVVQRDILTLLDQKFFPHMRDCLEHGLGILTIDSSGINFSSNLSPNLSNNTPILVKYLLIAAYICQVNRPEKDRQMFCIEKNGKRQRKTKEDDTGEEVAFGSHDPLKTMRLRTFPVERLYSLYVSIVSLNASNILLSTSQDESEMLKSLGNVPFLETVTYLRDIGVFHDFPKRSPTEPIRFTQRYFWTSITRDDAMEIATSIDFPLDRYIL